MITVVREDLHVTHREGNSQTEHRRRIWRIRITWNSLTKGISRLLTQMFKGIQDLMGTRNSHGPKA